MNKHYNPNLKANASNLRRDMTKEERHLWYDCLKLLPVTVHRQKILDNYIVDFYIASGKIVIELDGSQHYEPENVRKDAQRDAHLREIGCTILRYSNADINMRFNRVCEDIYNHLQERGLIKPSPRGEAFGKAEKRKHYGIYYKFS